MSVYRLTLFAAVVIATARVADSAPAVEALHERQAELSAAIERTRSAVVGVSDGFGVGSGVVVSNDGYIYTASHVVDSPGRRRRPRRISVTFPDGEQYQAELLGMNRFADAALLKISEKPRTESGEFPFVETGRSAELSRGDWCFALGHPGGMQEGRAAPIRLGRVLSVGHLTVVSDNAIVLGDSGGPLFDLSGRLIGIHSMITEVIVENRHVAVDVWERDRERLLAGERWGRLRAFDNELAESEFVGLFLRWKDFEPVVSRVVSGSPADHSGFRVGDRLISMNGSALADRLELSNLLWQADEQQKLTFRVRRGNADFDVDLMTGEKPDEEDEETLLSTEEAEARLREYREQRSADRRVGPHEKRAAPILAEFRDACSDVSESVVAVRELGVTLCLGMIVSEDGFILVKDSELEHGADPEIVLADGRRFGFRKIAADYAYDIALIRIDADGLKPVNLAADEPIRPGRILITPDVEGRPLLPGVVSVETRRLQTASRGFMGVELQERPRGSSGVRIRRILRGGAAQRGGLRDGDIVHSVNGNDVNSVQSMIRMIGEKPPGSLLKVRFERDDRIRTIELVLTPRFIADRSTEVFLSRYTDSESAGKYASAHSSGFPEAFQHDTDLFPSQCGGPLLDIDGNVIGMNIARAARIVSYAIPASAVQRVYKELRASDFKN